MKRYFSLSDTRSGGLFWRYGVWFVACLLSFCLPSFSAFAQDWSGSILVKLKSAQEIQAQKGGAGGRFKPTATVSARQSAQELAAAFSLGEPDYYLYPPSASSSPGVAVMAKGDEERDRYLRVTPPSADTLDGLVASLSRDPRVAYAEKEPIVRAIGTANDPFFGEQYAHSVTQASLAWDVHTGGPGVTVAIVDTGVDLDHPDLRYSLVAGTSFVDESPDDENGHGTHCAGIAAASGNNGEGIAGASWAARIMPIQVLDGSGSGTLGDVAAGIRYAADQGVSVISLSLGSSEQTQTMQDAVDYARSKDTVVVAAAGNSGTDERFYPGGCDGVVAVGATNHRDSLTEWSNFGDWVTLFAPGDSILSTYLDGGYEILSGTSMATPYVAGAAALLRSYKPELNEEAVKGALRQSTDDIGDQNPTDRAKVQQGRINLARLLGVLPRQTAVLNYIGRSEIVGNQDGQATSGEQIAIRVSVRNLASIEKTFRLVGSSESSAIELVNVEGTIGPVAPGTTMEVSIKSSVVVRMLDRGNPYGEAPSVRLRLLEGDAELQRLDTKIPFGFRQIAGFPVVVPGGEAAGPVTVDDINGDGNREALFPLIDMGWNGFWIVDRQGAPIPGLQIRLPNTSYESVTGRNVAVGNVVDDSRKEIVVGSDRLGSTEPTAIHVFSSNGELLPGFPRALSDSVYIPEVDESRAYGITTPTLVDIDGNGLLDIVLGEGLVSSWFSSWAPSRMFAIGGDGADLLGFPFEVEEQISPRSPVIVDDLNGDGGLEFSTVVDSSAINVWDKYGSSILSRRLWSLGGSDSIPLGLASFPLLGQQRGLSSLGTVGAGMATMPGSEVPGFRSTRGLPQLPDSWNPEGESQVPLWGDFDSDGAMEGVYVMPSKIDGQDTLLVNAVDLKGLVKPGFPIQLSNLPTTRIVGQIVSEDLDGDKSPELVIPMAHGVEIRSPFGRKTFSATILFSPTSALTVSSLTPTIGDLNGDGVAEVLFSSQSETGDLLMNAYELPGTGLGNEPFWPMYQRDPKRTGRLTNPNLTPLAPTPVPAQGRVTLRLYQAKVVVNGRAALKVNARVGGATPVNGDRSSHLNVRIACRFKSMKSERAVPVRISGSTEVRMRGLSPKMKCQAKSRYLGKPIVSNVRSLR